MCVLARTVLKGHSVWEDFPAESEPDTEQAKEITRELDAIQRKREE